MLRGNIQSFIVKYDVRGTFFVDVLDEVEEVPSASSLLGAFIMNRCWILSNVFSA